jgi:hypothetical protein
LPGQWVYLCHTLALPIETDKAAYRMSLTHLPPYSTISYQIQRPLFNTGASHLPSLQAPPQVLPFTQTNPADVFLPVSPNQPLGVGALAPDFVLPNQNGQYPT